MTGQHEWSDMPKAFTVGMYLPPGTPDKTAKLLMKQISAHLQEVLGVQGEVWKIDHDCECCSPHIYLSTSCFHGNHTYCQNETGLIGTKIPGECKFCHSKCICPCHRETEEEKDTVDG